MSAGLCVATAADRRAPLPPWNGEPDTPPFGAPNDGGSDVHGARQDLRLLLVEDSPSDALYVAELAEGWATVHHVERLVDALDALAERPFDAVLLDLGLPDARGLDGLARVRREFPLTPVVVLTGVDRTLALQALRAGAQDYLSKDGLSEPALVRAVMHGLARHREVERIEAQRQRAVAHVMDLRSVLDAVPDALVLLDEEGRIALANEAATSWLLPPGASDVAALDAVLEAGALDAARHESKEGRATTPEGAERWLVVRVVEARWAGRRLSCVVARDVTARKRAEAAALAVRESERLVALGQLAASVAHEINNPMAAIAANLEVLRDRSDELGSEEATTMVGECLDASRRIAVIVGDLLTFARAERAEVGRVDLARVLDAAVNLCASRVRRDGVVVERRYGAAPLVAAVEGRLLQVTSNLVGNALDALREAGRRRLTLETGTFDGGVYLAVEDDGVGMTRETAARAEEPFFTTKSQRGGTGLGLSVCADIARAHGGSLAIRSALGHGTRVELRLPVDTGLVPDGTPARPPSRPPSATAERPFRVVLVDDEAMVGRAYRRLLEPECIVRTFTGGAEALEGLDEDADVDLVLCDVEMPRMNGILFLEAVRLRYPSLVSRVVFYTGGVFDPETSRELAEGAVRVLPKPVPKDEVLSLLRRLARDSPGRLA